MDPINKVIIVLFELSISLFLIFLGWRILRHGIIYLFPNIRFGLWLLGLANGQEAADKKRAELTSPQQMQSFGRQAIVYDFLALLVTIWTILNDAY